MKIGTKAKSYVDVRTDEITSKKWNTHRSLIYFFLLSEPGFWDVINPANLFIL